jgi:hypothetical protein
MNDRPDMQLGGQLEQDKIVLALLNGRRDGFFIDIGCGTPLINSNTYLLEKHFGWRGIGIDVTNQPDAISWADRPNTQHIVADATTFDYATLVPDGTVVDFLSLDLEPPALTYDVLRMLPLDSWRPHVIAYEADAYRDDEAAMREHQASEYLRAMGYSLRARLYPRVLQLLTDDVGCQDHIYMRADILRLETRWGR